MKKKYQSFSIFKFLMVIVMSKFVTSKRNNQKQLFEVPPRDDDTKTFGERIEMCKKEHYEQMELSSQTVSTNMNANYSSSGTVSQLHLATLDQQTTANVFWYKRQLNFINGFKLSFNLDITDKYEGFAIILQQQGSSAQGNNYDGLGYAGIGDSLSIEFDNKYSDIKNDPETPHGRHLSVILAKANQADEVNAIGWNNQPINYNQKDKQNYLHQPLTIITYQNQMLSIQINGILQLAIYHPIDLHSFFKTSSNQYYLGITSSTNSITHNQTLHNVSLSMVTPQVNLTTYHLSPTQSQIGHNITLFLNTFKACNNPYIPIEGIDSPHDLSIISLSKSCQVIDKTVFFHNYTLDSSTLSSTNQPKSQYKMVIQCNSAGQHNIQVVYKSHKIDSQLVTVMAEEVSQVIVKVLSMLNGVCTVSLNYLDTHGNKANRDIDNIMSNLMLSNGPIDVPFKLYQGIDNSLYQLTFNYSQNADYLFTEQGLEVADAKVIVRLQTLNLNQSKITLLDNHNNLLIDSNLQSGQTLHISSSLLDKESSPMDLPIQYHLLNSLNHKRTPLLSNIIQINSTGQYRLVNNLSISCENCQLSVSNDNQPIVLNNTIISLKANGSSLSVYDLVKNNNRIQMFIQLKDQYNSPKVNHTLNISASIIDNSLSLCTKQVHSSFYLFQCNSNKADLSSGTYSILLKLSDGSSLTRSLFILNKRPVITYSIQKTLVHHKEYMRILKQYTLSFQLMNHNQRSYYQILDNNVTLSSDKSINVISGSALEKGQYQFQLIFNIVGVHQISFTINDNNINNTYKFNVDILNEKLYKYELGSAQQEYEMNQWAEINLSLFTKTFQTSYSNNDVIWLYYNNYQFIDMKRKSLYTYTKKIKVVEDMQFTSFKNQKLKSDFKITMIKKQLNTYTVIKSTSDINNYWKVKIDKKAKEQEIQIRNQDNMIVNHELKESFDSNEIEISVKKTGTYSLIALEKGEEQECNNCQELIMKSDMKIDLKQSGIQVNDKLITYKSAIIIINDNKMINVELNLKDKYDNSIDNDKVSLILVVDNHRFPLKAQTYQPYTLNWQSNQKKVNDLTQKKGHLLLINQQHKDSPDEQILQIENIQFTDDYKGIQYSKKGIHKANIVTHLPKRRIKAGETVRVLVELRDSDGVLVNPGNAEQTLHQVKIKEEDQLNDYSYLKGEWFGTYLLSFRPTQVGPITLTLQYMDYNKNRFTLIRQLLVHVIPASLHTIEASGHTQCQAGSYAYLLLKGYDLFGNSVEQLSLNDLTIEPPTNTFTYNQYKHDLKVLCAQVGNMTINSIYLHKQLEVQPDNDQIDMLNSQLSIHHHLMAGAKEIPVNITLRDKHNNTLHTTQFSIQHTVIDHRGQQIHKSNSFLNKGEYKIFYHYQNRLIGNTAKYFQVSANSPTSIKVEHRIKCPLTQRYIYKHLSKNTSIDNQQNILDIKVTLLDSYGNTLDYSQQKDKIKIHLQIKQDYSINLCQYNGHSNQFTICQHHLPLYSSLSLEVQLITFYNDLTHSQSITLTSQPHPPFSTLKVNNKNSLFKRNQHKQTHQSGSIIETVLEAKDNKGRPIDLINKRIEIKVDTRDDLCYYNYVLLSRSTLLIQYYSTLTQSSNILRLQVGNTLFKQSFSIKNSKAKYFFQSNKNSHILNKAANRFNVDSKQNHVYIRSYDRFLNNITNVNRQSLNIDIKDHHQNQLSTSQYQVYFMKNNLIRIKLLIKTVGNYMIHINNAFSLPITLTVGKINKVMSQVSTTKKEIVAGDKLVVEYALKDQYGNPINQFLNKDYNEQNKSSIKWTNRKRVTIQPTKKGIKTVQLVEDTISLEPLKVEVIAGQVHINSGLQTYQPEKGEYKYTSLTETTNQFNQVSRPIFYLQPKDKYNNTIDNQHSLHSLLSSSLLLDHPKLTNISLQFDIITQLDARIVYSLKRNSLYKTYRHILSADYQLTNTYSNLTELYPFNVFRSNPSPNPNINPDINPKPAQILFTHKLVIDSCKQTNKLIVTFIKNTIITKDYQFSIKEDNNQIKLNTFYETSVPPIGSTEWSVLQHHRNDYETKNGASSIKLFALVLQGTKAGQYQVQVSTQEKLIGTVQVTILACNLKYLTLDSFPLQITTHIKQPLSLTGTDKYLNPLKLTTYHNLIHLTHTPSKQITKLSSSNPYQQKQSAIHYTSSLINITSIYTLTNNITSYQVIQPIIPAIWQASLNRHLLTAGEQLIINLNLTNTPTNTSLPLIRYLYKYTSQSIYHPFSLLQQQSVHKLFTKAGQLQVKVLINNQRISCPNCLAQVLPGPLVLPKSWMDNQPTTTRNLKRQSIESGSSDLLMYFTFFDKYSNRVSNNHTINSLMSLIIHGHNTSPITLFQTIPSSNKQMLSSLPLSSQHSFESLVPANNYIVNITYLNQTHHVNLDLTGDDIPEHGNGEVVYINTLMTPPSAVLVKCNDNVAFTLSFYTKENQLFNGHINTTLIHFNSTYSHNVTYDYQLLPTSVHNQFIVVLTWTHLCSYKNTATFNTYYNNTHIANNTIKHFVYNPNVSLTRLVTNLPAQMIDFSTAFVSLQIYHMQNGLITDKDYANKIQLLCTKGYAQYSNFTYDDKYQQYTAKVTPLFKKNNGNIVNFMVVYEDAITGAFKKLINQTIITEVIQEVYYDYTIIQGIPKKQSKVSVEDSLQFNVSLLDQHKNCYDRNDITLMLKVSGIYRFFRRKYYSQQIKYNKNLQIKNKKIDHQYHQFKTIKSNESLCLYTYQLNIKKQSPFIYSGIYKLDFGGKKLEAYEKIKQTYMYLTFGKFDIKRTKLIITNKNKEENGALVISVEEVINIQVKLYDQFENLVQDYGQIISFTIPGMDKKYYNQKQKIRSRFMWRSFSFQKQIRIKMRIFKTGLINKMILHVNNEKINIRQLRTKMKPTQFLMIPGKISNKYPTVYYQGKQYIGDKQRINIQPRDAHNNIINERREEDQDTSFTCDIKGTDMPNVTSIDIVYNEITQLKNGTFQITYILPWTGNYQFNIQLHKSHFKEIKLINSTYFYKCDASAPYLCAQSRECVTHYSKCKPHAKKAYRLLNPEKCGEQQYLCKVSKKYKCVNARHECDCPSLTSKCAINNICMSRSEYGLFCQIGKQDCNRYTCPGGQCRQSQSQCPSLQVCPPGYKMCANSLCIEQHKVCSKAHPYMITNYLSPLSPLTGITCSNQTHVVCPDRTCKQSEWLCDYPQLVCKQTIQSKYYQCPDYSCINSKFKNDHCPTFTSCPPMQALCQNHICAHNCTSPSLTIPIDSLVTCPDGTRVRDYYHCGKTAVCNKGQFRCQDQSCVSNSNQCIQLTCQSHQFKCWDGRCVSHSSLCSTQHTCPSEYPFKCMDGMCVTNTLQCNVQPCPSYAPYRCSNGECYINANQCTTLLTCPSYMPILCSDNQCVKSPQQCLNILLRMITNPFYKQSTNSDTNTNSKWSQSSSKLSKSSPFFFQWLKKYIKKQIEYNERNYNLYAMICPDRSISLSKYTCSKEVTCAPGETKCWDNSCVASLSDCSQSLMNSQSFCSPSLPVRCSDGSCSNYLYNCPTQINCPLEKNIRCSDGNCRSNIEECSVFSSCPKEMKQCPSGACVKETCGTGITCMQGERTNRFKCWDQTCKKDPRDCPPLKTCFDPPIQCPDGSCVSSRELCHEIMDKCPPNKPVKCPDLTCQQSITDCKQLNSHCPVGFILCSDNTCRIHQNLCPPDQCPIIRSVKCPDGNCVSNKKYCDSSVGCPYDRPERCGKNGQCVKSLTECEFLPSVICKIPLLLCPDGSCRSTKKQCPNEQGCPLNKPQKCANGNCIDPAQDQCDTSRCSIEKPIKCADGQCVQTISMCKASLQQYNNSTNTNTTTESTCQGFACASGRCVVNQLMCPAIRACANGMERCKDGSCRILKRFCPVQATLCPQDKPYMCNIGTCEKDKDNCQQLNGCYKQLPYRCKYNGQCVKGQKVCHNIFKKLSIGTDQENQTNKIEDDVNILLQSNKNKQDNNGKKLKSKKTQSLSGAKQDSQQKSDVANDLQLIEANENNTQNKQKQSNLQNEQSKCNYICPDNSCKSDFSKCLTFNGCPVEQPIRCNKNKCSKSLIDDDPINGCQPTHECTSQKSIKCGDGSCTSDSTTCQNIIECPNSKPHRCNNMKCMAYKQDCDNQNNCPATNPIMCYNGQCVNDQIECNNLESMYCPREFPIKCASGVCVSQNILCTLDNQKQSSVIPSNQSTTPSTSTPSTFPNETFNSNHRSLQESSSIWFTCSDGSTKKHPTYCTLPSGCTTSSLPYLCPSGRCQSTSPLHQQQPNLQCPPNTHSCEDGICRHQCPLFNGCPLQSPLHCPGGHCANSWVQCAGYDQCPLNAPYRIHNATCTNNNYQSLNYLRDLKFNLITLTINPNKNREFNLNDRTGVYQHATLTINHQQQQTTLNTTTTTTPNNQQDDYPMTISNIPDSNISTYTSSIVHKQYKDTNPHFPANHYTLHHYQSVRSPSFRIQYPLSLHSTQLQMYLTVLFDQLINTTSHDYCLGIYNHTTNDISCLPNNPNLIKKYTGEYPQAQFQVPHPGDYAVLFSPDSKDDIVITSCDDLCKYVTSANLAYNISLFVISLLVAIYIFYKVFNLFTKLKQSKERGRKFQENLEYILSLQGSQVQGEGVKDSYLGILFKKNPAYKKQTLNSIENINKLKDLKQKVEEMKQQEEEYKKDNEELRQINETLVEQQIKKQQIDRNQSEELIDDQEQFNEENLLIDSQFTQ